MRAKLHYFAVAAVAFAMVFGDAAHAQTVPCVTGGMMGGVMLGIGGGMNNSPFSATVKSTFEQKLADGNVIHTVTRSHQARDSAGRTMTEMPQGCVLGEDGQMHQRLSVNVNDPVARTNISWQVGDDRQQKVAHVFHQPEMPRPAIKRELSPEESAQQQRMMQAARAQQALQQKENHTEDLGTRDFNGVLAHGTRNTRTIPAGEEGNDQPLVVINENWRSREMGLTVMTISDDPRRGRTVTEYEDLTLREPDPALFAPPADYKVEEQMPGGMAGVVAY